MHHGVPGQKWGTRRYQNADGSLTAEGRIHYGINGVRPKGQTTGIKGFGNMVKDEWGMHINASKVNKRDRFESYANPTGKSVRSRFSEASARTKTYHQANKEINNYLDTTYSKARKYEKVGKIAATSAVIALAGVGIYNSVKSDKPAKLYNTGIEQKYDVDDSVAGQDPRMSTGEKTKKTKRREKMNPNNSHFEQGSTVDIYEDDYRYATPRMGQNYANKSGYNPPSEIDDDDDDRRRR